MDDVEQEVENLKKQWDDTFKTVVDKIKSIENYGKPEQEEQIIETQNNKESLPRMKGIVQDGLSLFNSLIFKLDLFAPQLPNDDQVEAAKALLESWQNLSKSLRQNFRDASLQANENIRKAAQKERELLLGGGSESTARRRNLQTKAGMTSAAESITESLRRTRQMMVQEVERTEGTLVTLGESTAVLGKAESDYKGHRSLLMRTRNLLSTMQRQDVIDRIIIGLGFFLFTCAVLYVVSKRI